MSAVYKPKKYAYATPIRKAGNEIQSKPGIVISQTSCMCMAGGVMSPHKIQMAKVTTKNTDIACPTGTMRMIASIVSGAASVEMRGAV